MTSCRDGISRLVKGLFGRTLLLCALLMTAAALGGAAQKQPDQNPGEDGQARFSVTANLVRLFVSVRDAASNAIVANLSKGDFTVFDSGVEQSVAVFERNTSLPLSVALVVDTSGSTRKDLTLETNSILKFLKALKLSGNAEDAMALYSFNWQVRMEVGFTRNEQRAEKALRLLHGEGGTSLYDAVYLVAGDVADREGRHVVVVVTDGGDTTSYKKFDDAVREAVRSDSILYPIVIVPIEADAGRNIGGEHALDTMARATGGRPFYPSGARQLDDAFADILRELRTQYLLGYYPRGTASGSRLYHKVSVKTAAPSLKVTTRSGYYEP